MEHWLIMVRAVGDLLSLAAALISLAVAIDTHRLGDPKGSKEPGA